MNYRSAIKYLESFIDYERTVSEARDARFFNLTRIEQLLEALGNPHHRLNCLHLAGTKGKGSTSAMVASILRAAGYRVGLYTSPHLVSFRERIRVNDELIPEEAVVMLTQQLRPHLEALKGTETGAPSFFEAYTAMAMLHFTEQQADFAVLETGLGGRLDATNIVTPKVCGLTTIAFDHMVELGDTLAKIAGEKAGIIKLGVPVVCAPQEPEATEVIQAVCSERAAPLIRVGFSGDACDIIVKAWPPTLEGQRISIQGRREEYQDLVCPLLGEYQAKNAGVAVGMVEVITEQGWEIGEAAIRQGIEQVRWPGRMQITGREPTIILDGAHDALSASELARTIRSLFPQAEITLVLGIASDKNIEGIADALCPIAAHVVLTAAKTPRAAKPEELLHKLAPRCSNTQFLTAPGMAEALKLAKSRAGKEGVVVVTGSLYVVGEAINSLSVSASKRPGVKPDV